MSCLVRTGSSGFERGMILWSRKVCKLVLEQMPQLEVVRFRESGRSGGFSNGMETWLGLGVETGPVSSFGDWRMPSLYKYPRASSASAPGVRMVRLMGRVTV